MSNFIRKLEPYGIATGLTILAGVLLRIGHLFLIPPGQPFRFGGLFLEFSHQIIQNGFSLPAVIPWYSQDGIPFAYPPLSFYVQALLISLFSPDKFLTVNLVPAIAAALSVPSFYILIRQFRLSHLEAWASLAAFVFMPNTFLEHIEAAGLPESFGLLVLIWYAIFFVKAYTSPRPAYTLAAGLFLGLNILASPGTAVAAPLLSLVFAFLFILRHRAPNPWHIPLLIGLIGLLVSAPWWMTVVRFHGPGIFIDSLSSQFVTGQKWTFTDYIVQRLLSFDFASLRHDIFLWSGLTLLGLVAYLTTPLFFLPLLFMLFFFLPREGVWLSAVLAAFLAGRGLALLGGMVRQNLSASPPARARTLEYLLLVSFVIAACFNAIIALRSMMQDRQGILDASDVRALEKYAPRIPPGASVIVMGHEAFREWAPHLLQRQVLNVPYGLEWQPGELPRVNRFNQALDRAASLDEIRQAVAQYYRLPDVYLVTSDVDGFRALSALPVPLTGQDQLVVQKQNILILHLVVE